MEQIQPLPIDLLILYASQTGNCEQISEDLLDRLKQSFPKARRFVFNDHPKKFDLQAKDRLKVCVFVMSSTGNGEFPDNGDALYRQLRKYTASMEGLPTQQSEMLSHVSYTILGLGDSNYSKYQGAPRTLEAALLKLGAQQFYPRGEADEATSLELVVEPWLEKLPLALKKEISNLKSINAEELKKRLTPIMIDEVQQIEPEAKKTVEHLTAHAIVTGGKFLIDTPDRQVIELELLVDKEVSKDLIDVGSSFSIYPQNRKEDVDFVISQMGWDESALIGNKTVREMVTQDIDIRSEKLKLSKFLSEYDMQFVPEELKKDPYLTLMRFVSHKDRLEGIPYSIIEDDLPRIKPRYFSIVNDPYLVTDSKSRTFQICFTVHKFGEHKMEGFCTSFLKDQMLSLDKAKIRVHFSHSNRIIHFDQDKWLHSQQPLIMICHGTGVVPFVSILSRIQSLLSLNQPFSFGPVSLFLGIRNNHEDFLYKEHLLKVIAELQSINSSCTLGVACSRELIGQEENMIKGYVQEYVSKMADQVREQVREGNGVIMVCGNKNTLGKSVMSVLSDVVLSSDEVDKLKRENRLILELWNE
ncbi:hypothetical protein FGO68_gene3840 [Halteria grandinella]|uniref:Methionine synthase reductase n=1 Tax=Halteria grandinella TaxID=5974 RepID=A0A8J8NUZ4_HALGN|nr:hypothetical protein FGO68_gene3840 [Halteria grandinella]